MMNENRDINYQTGNDRVILFIHGVFETPSLFLPVMEYFKDHGFDCKACRLPGHSESGVSFSEASFEAYADMAFRQFILLEQKYKKIFLVGHSLGGLICLQITPKTTVDGIILIHTPLYSRVKMKKVIQSSRMPVVVDGKGNSYLAETVPGEKISLPRIPVRMKSALDAARTAKRLKRNIGKVHVPVLIVSSMNDRVADYRDGVRLKRQLGEKRTRLILLRESGHASFTEKELNSLIKGISDFVTKYGE